MLRKIPMLPQTKLSARFTAATIVAPRAARPEMFFPISSAGVSAVQFVPPLVVRNIPFRAPPSHGKLLNRPKPATSVLCVPSEESSVSAPIESERKSSPIGVHAGLAAVALVVFQTPPFAAPIQTMSAFSG